MIEIIAYYKKSVYGKTLLYAKDKSVAKALEKLTGRRTLTAQNLNALLMLGFELEQVLEEDK